MFFILTLSPFFAGTILQMDYPHHEGN